MSLQLRVRDTWLPRLFSRFLAASFRWNVPSSCRTENTSCSNASSVSRTHANVHELLMSETREMHSRLLGLQWKLSCLANTGPFTEMWINVHCSNEQILNHRDVGSGWPLWWRWGLGPGSPCWGRGSWLHPREESRCQISFWPSHDPETHRQWPINLTSFN